MAAKGRNRHKKKNNKTNFLHLQYYIDPTASLSSADYKTGAESSRMSNKDLPTHNTRSKQKIIRLEGKEPARPKGKQRASETLSE